MRTKLNALKIRLTLNDDMEDQGLFRNILWTKTIFKFEFHKQYFNIAVI